MSLYSDSGLRLMRDAKRASTLNSLAPYRDELVKDILTESRHLTQTLQSLYATLSALKQNPQASTQTPSSILAATVLYEQALRQNKRMFLAYTRHRFERLRYVLWSLGIGSASIQLPDFISRHVSPPEMKLRNRYQELISNYRSRLGDLDLGSEDIPPKDVYVEVRVLKECGQVLTEDGIVRLSKGSMHHLKRSQVEKLVRAGFLLHVD